jgi:hypothetical protein
VRDAKGRFVKGESGNPKGRDKRETEAAYLQAIRDGVSLGDWAAIIARAVSDAKRGDRAARDFLADRLIGPVKQSVDVTNSSAFRVVIDVSDTSAGTQGISFGAEGDTQE